MTNPQNVVVNSTTKQTGAKAGDYKTLLILDTHFHTFERVMGYAPGGYDNLPVGSSLRLALDAAFSTNVKPAIVKVGRVKGNAVWIPQEITSGDSYGFTLTVQDGYSLNVAYTALVGDDSEDVVNGLIQVIAADSDITDHVNVVLSGSGANGALVVSTVLDADDFTLSDFVGNYSLTGTSTEVVSEALESISEIDDEWSWVTCTSTSPPYQLSLAAAVEVMEYKKCLLASSRKENYETWDGVSIPDSQNLAASVNFNNYKRTNVFYHHDTDSYPQIRRYSQFALLEPGRSNFQYKALSGVPVALVEDMSRALNAQELLNLSKVNATTVVRDGGVSYVGGYNGLGGRMSDGTRIESVYWTDRAAQVIKQKILTLQLNRDKLAMNDNDIAIIKGFIQSWLTTQVSVLGSTYALDPQRPFKITCPRVSEISFDDKVAGLLKGLTVVAYSDASIDKVISDLTVTFYDPALEA